MTYDKFTSSKLVTIVLLSVIYLFASCNESVNKDLQGAQII